MKLKLYQIRFYIGDTVSIDTDLYTSKQSAHKHGNKMCNKYNALLTSDTKVTYNLAKFVIPVSQK